MKESAVTGNDNTENGQRHRIAHDLNNVMMIVGNSAEMILDMAAENPHLKKVGERLQRAAERGTALAAELDTLSKNR